MRGLAGGVHPVHLDPAGTGSRRKGQGHHRVHDSHAAERRHPGDDDAPVRLVGPRSAFHPLRPALQPGIAAALLWETAMPKREDETYQASHPPACTCATGVRERAARLALAEARAILGMPDPEHRKSVYCECAAALAAVVML